jgi:protein gp37
MAMAERIDVKLAPEKTLTEPLRRRKPTTYFVNSMSDLFHEDVPDEWIDRVFAVMALCPQHTFQVLTKRSERMRAYMACVEIGRIRAARWGRSINRDADVSGYGPNHNMIVEGARMWPLPNVWIGVSCEDQRSADERVPDLLATPAAVRFVSAEPLLGPIDFERLRIQVNDAATGQTVKISNPFDAFHGMTWGILTSGQHIGKRFYNGGRSGYGRIDLIIVGGESGPGARPMHPDWARSIRDQCQSAGVPFFFKQWGAWEIASTAVAMEAV